MHMHLLAATHPCNKHVTAPPGPSLPMPLPQVNLPAGDYYRVDQVAPDDTFLGQLLCIQNDANPNLGNLYSGELRYSPQAMLIVTSIASIAVVPT